MTAKEIEAFWRVQTNTALIWGAGFLALMLAGACAQASAQTYPAKPIRLVVGFPPGGSTPFCAKNFPPPRAVRCNG